jgi:uncharacterized membrane protein
MDLLLLLVLVLAFLFWIIGVPILLLVRTARIRDLGERLDRLEHQLARLPRPTSDRPVPRATAETVVADIVPAPDAVGQSAGREPAEDYVVPAAPSLPPAGPRQPPVLHAPLVMPRSAALPPSGFDWEAWIGRRGLGWLAVVLLVFAVGFFLKYAFENHWIGPLGRVVTGMLFGVALIVLGLVYHLRGAGLFSQMLTAAGAALLYLTTWAAFGFYQLLPREAAGVFLVILVIEIAGLSLLYDAFAIALMAVIGGLLTPVLLASDQDLYRSLFLYLGLLNLGVVVLILLRAWPVVGTVALVGSQLLFGAWMKVNYHPEKLPAALLFQGALLGMYLLPVVGSALRRRTGTVLDLVRLLINSVLGSVMLHALLYDDYRVWLGSLALGLAVVHALLAWLVSSRNPEDERQLFVLVAVALGLIAVAFAWQADVAWIAVGWAVEGTALWWFGLKVRMVPLRVLGGVFLLLAVGRLLFVDTPLAHRTPFVPLFNSYALPALAVAACVIFTAVVSRYSPLSKLPLDEVGMWAAGIAGILLTWFIVSFETYRYFTTQISSGALGGMMVDESGQNLGQLQYEEGLRLERTAQMALSLVWAVYAGVILTIGFLRHNPPLRWTALGLFGLTLGKVVLVDMANLPGFYRVAVFLALALVLGAAARIYQRMQLQHASSSVEAK